MLSKLVGPKVKFLFLFLLCAMVLVWIMPLYSLFANSFRLHGIDNYIKVIKLKPFPYFFLNSVIISSSTLIIRLSIVSLAAYAFSRMIFPFKNFLFFLAIIGLFTPPFTLMVSLFQTVKTLSLLDTLPGVILPLVSFGISFNLLLFKNYFDTIPDALFDAADIDGAGFFKKYLNIILPLGKPIIFTGALFTFLNSWNEFFLPLLFVRTTEKYPITLSPYYFMSAYTSDYAKVYAAMILISIPIIIIYIIGQRYLESGLTGGAVK